MPKTKKTLPTWAGRSKFQYDGSVSKGTMIYAGQKVRKYRVPEDDYTAIRKRFAGQEVCIGTNRIDPPKDSVGAWLQKEGRSYGMMSYMGPILIETSIGQSRRLTYVEAPWSPAALSTGQDNQLESAVELVSGM